MNRKLATILIICFSVLAAIVVSMLPVPSQAAMIKDFQSQMAGSTIIMLLAVGAAVLFLSGLAGFKTAFRQTYYLICIGLIMQVLGTGIYVAGQYMGLQESVYLKISNEIPLVIGDILLFVGFCKFALLLRLQSALLKPIAIAGIFALSAFIAWFVLHRPINVSAPVDFVQLLMYSEVFFYTACAIIIFRIRDVASSAYRQSLTLFLIAMILSVAGAVGVFAEEYFNYPSWARVIIIGLPYMLTNGLLLIAGYAFTKITLLPADAKTHDVKGDKVVDSIVFLASLASRQQELDPILDRLRRLTAERNPDEPWSTKQLQELTAVYREVEKFLISKEQLRDFTQKQLRALVEERFDWIPPTQGQE